MRLCVIFGVFALALARPDVSELPGYKYLGPAAHQHSSSSQYASQFGSGTLEVIPLNLAHVSTTIHRSGEAGFGTGSSEYTSSYSNSQYSSGGSGYTSGGNNLGAQYYAAGANPGGQYSSGATFGGQYSSGANLGGQYSSGANLGGQYSSGAGLGAQYSSGARLGAQYVSGASDSSNFAQNSGFTSSGSSNDASFGYHQLINDVLSGKYTVGSYNSNAHTASSQKQKININIQPNQAPITYRHVYFAEAPADAPVPPRIHIEGAIQPRKHVKVVFIKTPDQGSAADQELTLPQLEEEKTQIYVLSKEHNHQPQIRIKAGSPAPASRPDIFFLKYRNEADALKAQQVLRENAGKNGFSAGSVLTNTNLSSGGASGFIIGGQSSGVSGLTGGQSSGASGFTGGQSSGASSSGFTAGLSSGLVSGQSSEFSSGQSSELSSGQSSELSSGQSAQSGSSNTGYTSGLSTGLSSGFTSNSASSFQSSAGIDGAPVPSLANLPLQEHSFTATGSKGVTNLYGAPVVGNGSSGGYV